MVYVYDSERIGTANFHPLFGDFSIQRMVATNIVEPPNNESIVTASFFHYLEVFLLRGTKSIAEYASDTFHYGRFFTMGSFSLLRVFIIKDSAVYIIHSGAGWVESQERRRSYTM